jgi:RNA polymerase sigma-70 factor (ECF subfamily)
MSERSFQDLIRRIRRGDQAAQTELVRTYEPALRRWVRCWLLRGSFLRPLVDSVDICQSVLSNFLVRAAAGAFDLHQEQDLRKLLLVMARNKLISLARKEAAGPRQTLDWDRSNADDRALRSAEIDPAEQTATRDLIQEVRRRLSPEERELAEQRSLGGEWAEIAATRDSTAEALRKRLRRALNRVARELGLVEVNHQ